MTDLRPPHPEALEASTNPDLGRTFNTKPAANPCAANPCAAKNPCGPQS